MGLLDRAESKSQPKPGLLARLETENQPKPGLFARLEAENRVKTEQGNTVLQNAEESGKEPESQIFTLDDIGVALKEKIRSLSGEQCNPYTILTLLKTYEAFHSAICLSLKNGNYSSYTSLQAGIETLTIPQGKLWSLEKAELSYFRFDFGTDDNLNYWIFPLKFIDNEPWGAVMLIEASDASFNPKAIAAILEGNTEKLLEQISEQSSLEEISLDNLDDDDSEDVYEINIDIEDNGIEDNIEGNIEIVSVDIIDEPLDEMLEEELEEVLEEELESLDQAPEEISIESSIDESSIGDDTFLEQKIYDFQLSHPAFACIVLEKQENGPKQLNTELSAMVSNIGALIPLAGTKSLVLLPQILDWELITHLITKTHNVKPLLSFVPDFGENVLERLQAYI